MNLVRLRLRGRVFAFDAVTPFGHTVPIETVFETVSF